jgi:hypothetical protein
MWVRLYEEYVSQTVGASKQATHGLSVCEAVACGLLYIPINICYCKPGDQYGLRSLGRCGTGLLQTLQTLVSAIDRILEPQMNF